MTNYWIGNDLAVFFSSLVLTGIIIPQILLIAYRKNLFDDADARKIHKGIVPRLGGIAFLPSIIFSICLIAAVNMSFGNYELGAALASTGKSVLYLVCALMLIFLVGISDDLVGVHYRAKFMIQIICALFICASGACVRDMEGLLWIHAVPEWLGWIVSCFVVVYLVNAINLIDGIDGLASGLSGMALIFYGIVLSFAGQWIQALIVWALLGTLVQFFHYNVFGNPQKRKKIFMGDTGSLTVGMVVSYIALSITHVEEVDIPAHYNPIVLAFSPVIIPAFDVVRVYFHRVRQRRNPFLPDKCHIHHKLLAIGLTQRTSLCVILLAAALFMVVNVVLSPCVAATWLLAGDIALWTGLNVALTRAIRQREGRKHVKLYE